MTWTSLSTGGCLLLNERRFLHYYHAVISNHLPEKPKICLVLYIWSFNTDLTKPLLYGFWGGGLLTGALLAGAGAELRAGGLCEPPLT